MCACSRPQEPRRTRSTSVALHAPPAVLGVVAATSNVVIETLGPERLRIEKARREAIRRSFG